MICNFNILLRALLIVLYATTDFHINLLLLLLAVNANLFLRTYLGFGKCIIKHISITTTRYLS